MSAPASLLLLLLRVCSTVLCIGLCSLRSINTLKYSSALAVAAVLTTVVMLVKNYASHPCKPGDCTDRVDGADWCSVGHCSGWCTAEQLSLQPEKCPGGVEGVSAWPRDGGTFLRALPLIAFALQCHIQGAAVYNEMPARLKSSIVVNAAIAATSSFMLVVLYLPIGLAGYAAFGAVTQLCVCFTLLYSHPCLFPITQVHKGQSVFCAHRSIHTPVTQVCALRRSFVFHTFSLFQQVQRGKCLQFTLH